MAELSDPEIEAALRRGETARTTEPRSASARYDAIADRVIIELTNGCAFLFPPALAQGLAGATPEQLANVEILGAGYGLHWEALDADLSVPGLIAGIFGSQAWMARRTGSATSPAKAAAPRANTAKGGRPKRASG